MAGYLALGKQNLSLFALNSYTMPSQHTTVHWLG